MKKLLALVLVTVMIAALVPITSVATTGTDTYFFTYVDGSSEFTYNTAYFMWPGLGSPNYPGVMTIEFTTPNDFDGCKFYCQCTADNPSVYIELLDRRGGALTNTTITAADCALISAPFDKVYPAGSYILRFTLLNYSDGTFFALRASNSSNNVLFNCTHYAENNASYTDPAPALILSLSPDAEYTGVRADNSTWLGWSISDVAIGGTVVGYWAGAPAGTLANLDPPQPDTIALDDPNSNFYMDIPFVTPRAFDGFKIVLLGSANITVGLYDDDGVKKDEVSKSVSTLLNGWQAISFIFSKGYAPGKYKLHVTFSLNRADIPWIVVGTHLDSTNEAGAWAGVGQTTCYYHNGFTPRIMLTGAINPEPFVYPAADHNADYWLCDPNTTIHTGFWMYNTAGVNEYIDITFDTPNPFMGFSTFLYSGGAAMYISVIDETGKVCEKLVYGQGGNNLNVDILFRNTYAPGRYTIRLEDAKLGAHMVLGGALTAKNDVFVTMSGNNTNAMGVVNPYCPYMKLIGCENPGSDYDVLDYSGTQWLCDVTQTMNNSWPMVAENQDTASRYVKIDFTSDIWFAGFKVATRGKGKVNVQLIKNNVVLEETAYSATDDTNDGYLLFEKSYSPGNYSLRIDEVPGWSSTDGNAWFFYLCNYGTTSSYDTRVSVSSNVWSPVNAAPAICLLGAHNFDKFISTNATIESGNVINLNFKADSYMLSGSDNAAADTVEFKIGKTTKTATGTLKDGKYVFTLSGISPDLLGETITATLHRTVGGNEQAIELLTDASGITAQGYFETLMGDASPATVPQKKLSYAALNYGTAAQEYMGMTSTIDMTSYDQTYAPAAENYSYACKEIINTPSGSDLKAKWKAVGLKIESQEEVQIRYTIEITDLSVLNDDDIKIVFTDQTNNNVAIEPVKLNTLSAKGNNLYLCYVTVPAYAMRDAIRAVICDKDNKALSGALTYSIEAYAAVKIAQYESDTTNEEAKKLADLVTAMMQYGDAAAALLP